MENKDVGTISRRDFLKLAGLGLGGIAAEAAFHPFVEAYSWLTRLGALDEGNIIQRTAAFNRLITQANNEAGRQNLEAWLKFNAAEMYALSKGWSLTAAFLRHSLYGQGQSVNITREYKSIIEKSSGKIENKYRFESYLEQALGNSLYLYTGNESYPASVTKFGDGQLKAQAVISPLSIPDLIHSLNRHTLILDGKLSAVSTGEGDNGPYLTGKYKGGVLLRDRYDWSKNNLSANGESIDILVQKLTSLFGVDAKKLPIPSEWWGQMEQEKIAVHDYEGASLQRARLIKPFDIEASYPRLDREIDIKISRNLTTKSTS